MPLVIRCEGCQQSHLIRDQLIGHCIRCDCGRTQTVPSDAPSVPAPTGLLDAPIVQVGSVGLLLVSTLILGGVIAWVVDLDAGSSSSKPAPSVPPTTRRAPPTTTKPKEPPTTKKQRDPERDDPRLLTLLKQLNAPDLETNEKAIKRMVELDDAIARRAIPAVIAAVQRQDNESFRQLAAQELKGRGAPLEKDYDCLKTALQISHPALQRYVTFALRELGEKARAALSVVVEAMKHRDPEVRREAFAILKNLKQSARAPAFRLLLNPNGHADEEASLDVLKVLLGESNSLSAEERDALIEALRDVKRRSGVRCFAVENLGKGEQAAGAVPVLLDVLREKGDVKLLRLSIKALDRIGDKRKDVLTSLLTLAASAPEEEVRLESLQVLEKLDPSALSVAQIIERWSAEKSDRVKQELDKMMQSRLAALKPEQMKDVLPLLKHKDAGIVLVGLKVVQAHREEAADVAAEVADLLKHNDNQVRENVLIALESIGPAVEKALPELPRLLLDRWSREKASVVREALIRLLQSRLAQLKREQMKDLLPVLGHKDTKIILVGLKAVQDHQEEAADVAVEVADLLRHENTRVRQAALNALQALGAAADKALPNLSRQLLAHWLTEKDTAVRLAVLDLLQSRFAQLKREQMKELLPVLGHRDAKMVLVGLKSVQHHKEEAADVAAEVVDLLKHEDATVRQAALTAVKALGTGAAKALPKLFEMLEQTSRHQRMPLALTIAGAIGANSSENVDRLVPFLLDALHPKSLQAHGDASEATIHRVLVKMGQPAVDGCFTILNASLRDTSAGRKDHTDHRKKLYEALTKLGPMCQSKGNYETLRRLWIKESKIKYNDDVTAAARAAMAAVDPD